MQTMTLGGAETLLRHFFKPKPFSFFVEFFGALTHYTTISSNCNWGGLINLLLVFVLYLFFFVKENDEWVSVAHKMMPLVDYIPS